MVSIILLFINDSTVYSIDQILCYSFTKDDKDVRLQKKRTINRVPHPIKKVRFFIGPESS